MSFLLIESGFSMMTMMTQVWRAEYVLHRYKVVVGVLAFDGSSHRLGWPLLLYGKRPTASLNCIPVDDCAVVIYRGGDVHPSYAEQDRGEDCPRTKKWSHWNCPFQELDGTMGSLLASYDHLMVNLRSSRTTKLLANLHTGYHPGTPDRIPGHSCLPSGLPPLSASHMSTLSK